MKKITIYQILLLLSLSLSLLLIILLFKNNLSEAFINNNSELLFSKIASKYSGKNNDTDGTDKSTVHSYDTVYDKILLPYKDIATSVLEIGIKTGAALNAYSEYFINANIYGIDIQNQILPQYEKIPKTKIYFGDALDETTINHFNTTYDIIIEDGSHLIEHQIQHFKDYSKFIKPGGMYVIEDVDNKYVSRLFNETHATSKDLNFILTIYDLRNNKDRFDDILFVFIKK